MLRKRSRAMGTNGSLSQKQSKPTSSFFGSPRFFTAFSVKGSSETESAMSPTSILDANKSSFASFVNPFWSEKLASSRLSPDPPLENKHHLFEKKLESKGVGLGIVDSLNDDDGDDEANNKILKPDTTRMVLFGSQLKIHIPPPPTLLSPPTGSPKTPIDFGIKTRNSQLGSSSFSSGLSPFGSSNSAADPPGIITGCLSASEMELSEDYTCVISRGPNPKTVHIFGDCIVENCCGVVAVAVPGSKKDTCFSTNGSQNSLPENFLSFCYNCKKKLDEGKDIYMYRGEKAFCSCECRHQEMMLDEGLEKSDLGDDSYRTHSL